MSDATVLCRITGYEDAAGVAGVDLRAAGHAVQGSMIFLIAAARAQVRAVQAVGRPSAEWSRRFPARCE